MIKTTFLIIIKVILYLFMFMMVVGSAQIVFAKIQGYQFENITQKDFSFPAKDFMILQILSAILTFVVSYFFLKWEKIKLRYLGWKFNLNEQLQAFLLGGIFIFLFFIILNLLHQITIINNLEFNYIQFLFLSIGLFFAAFVEELAFRGYLLKMLGKNLNLFWSLCISSATFALLHMENPNLGIIPWINLFLAGMVLGFIYYKTKNIWFVTILHFSWNWTQTVVGFNVSGQDFNSYFQFKKIQENIFTGGPFGFEGSVLAIVSLFFLFLIFKTIPTKKPYEI